MTGRLSEEDVRRIAEATADVLAERGLVAPAAPELVDAAEVGRRLGLSADYVRRHAAQLGGVKVGDGARGRWRFDPAVAAGGMNPSKEGVGSAVGAESGPPSGSPAPARRNSRTDRRASRRTGRALTGGEMDISRVPSMAQLVKERRGGLDLDVGARDDRGGKRNGAAARKRSAPGDEE